MVNRRSNTVDRHSTPESDELNQSTVDRRAKRSTVPSPVTSRVAIATLPEAWQGSTRGPLDLDFSQLPLSWSGLPLPKVGTERTTRLRKSLGGRPARGGPRMTKPAEAERVPLPGWPS
ncbi:unnamed protein product [Cuscuta campestris]|uniref:Uncharacterized protein n=1 Tax=Cuscuta campestris TaxID=132261 RepID=A0A484N629_9ASTE|nr:unnamed protein product [Cuscuta campestris]